MARPEVLLVAPMMASVTEALEADYVIHRLYEAQQPQALVASVAQGVRAIATNGHDGASSKLIDGLPNLEIIACYGVGVDAIDLSHAERRVVIVTNTPDVLTDDTANMAVALLLSVSRGIVGADRYVRSGDWLERPMRLTSSLRGKRIGILGLGRIGKDVARKLDVFGCEISYHGRHQQPDQAYPYADRLLDLARQSDYVVVTCPGGAETRHLVEADILNAIGPQGGLINIARGSVVSEKDLVAALVEGRLGGAGLDVFEEEPNVPRELMELDNVVLQPHQGSATIETRWAMSDLVVRNLAAHFARSSVLTPVKVAGS